MKNDIVRKALEAGVLLTPKLLEEASETQLESMIEEARGKKVPIITERLSEKSRASIKTTKTKARNMLTPDDYAKYFSNKYEGIRRILLNKVDAVSINKIFAKAPLPMNRAISSPVKSGRSN